MIDFDTVKSESIGRFPGILSALGIEVGTGKHCPCPICGGEDRFKFEDIDKKRTGDANGSYFCNQCGPGTGIDLVMGVLKVEYKEAMEAIARVIGTVEPSKHQAEKKMTPDIMRKMFMDSAPVQKGDPVHWYLKERGLSHIPWALKQEGVKIPTLRYGKCWEAETKENQDTMLAVFTLPDGTAVTMHRTFLRNGKKLPIDAPKKFMPTLKPLAGGAIRLYDVGPILGVAEGIETAMACHQIYSWPVWPVIGTAMMESFEPPKEVETLVIFSDNDANYAGQKAAYALANRVYIKNKISVDMQVPDVIGTDFLDEMIRNK